MPKIRLFSRKIKNSFIKLGINFDICIIFINYGGKMDSVNLLKAAFLLLAVGGFFAINVDTGNLFAKVIGNKNKKEVSNTQK